VDGVVAEALVEAGDERVLVGGRLAGDPVAAEQGVGGAGDRFGDEREQPHDPPVDLVELLVEQPAVAVRKVLRQPHGAHVPPLARPKQETAPVPERTKSRSSVAAGYHVE